MTPVFVRSTEATTFSVRREGWTMRLRKNAVILTADKFEDLEVFFPLFSLLEAGWNVDVSAPTKREIGGEHG